MNDDDKPELKIVDGGGPAIPNYRRHRTVEENILV